MAKKDSFERIAAQVIASDPKSFLAKNPTRAVPDLPGEDCLITCLSDVALLLHISMLLIFTMLC